MLSGCRMDQDAVFYGESLMDHLLTETIINAGFQLITRLSLYTSCWYERKVYKKIRDLFLPGKMKKKND